MNTLSLQDVMNNHQHDVAIFIATHKNFSFPYHSELYIPIQVGETSNLPYLSEYQLENIAYKNKNFCELTVLYFIWKNIHCPFVGLVHYRRYFVHKNNTLTKTIRKIQYTLGLKTKMFNPNYDFINDKEIEVIFQSGIDIIVSEALIFKEDTVYQQYDKHHHIHDWLHIRTIIETLYPEYLPTFDKVSHGHILYPYNMFIGKKHIIDQYCEWLFNILFESEKLIDYRDYDDYNKRVFGFLAERLFTVWIEHHAHHFKIAHLPVAMANI